MNDPVRIVDTPEWRALQAHFDALRDVHLRQLFADDPRPGRDDDARGRRPLPRLLEEPAHRRDDRRCSSRSPGAPGSSSCATRCSRGEKINVTEQRAVLHVALRAPDGRADRGRRRRRRARGPRRARPDGRLLGPGPLRRVDRPHRQADPQRRQHRHRRQRPRAAHGHDALRRLQRPLDDVPLRLERRRHRLLRGDARPRPRGDAVHHRLEDLHDARDDDQRPHRPRLVARRARRRRRGGQALRRRLDQRGRGREVRHRHRQHVRVLGLGRRPLLATTPRSGCR